MKSIPLLLLVSALLSQFTLAAEHTVEMRNASIDGTMVFSPGVVKAEVGDTIHFVPVHKGHNAETIPGLIPEGATGWKGAINATLSVTLDKEGVYVYQCRPHAAMAMVGVVVAGQPVNIEAVRQRSGKLSSTFTVHQYRLEEYLDRVE